MSEDNFDLTVRVNQDEETLEEKMIRKLKKTFLRSFWKNVNTELPVRSGTYWGHICVEGELCQVMHQDRVYYSAESKEWHSDSLRKENGKVTHWAYPIPPPRD